jgi:hypothetical protein
MIGKKIKIIATRIKNRDNKPLKISSDVDRWLSTEFGKEKNWAEYMYKTGQFDALTKHGSYRISKTEDN